MHLHPEPALRRGAALLAAAILVGCAASLPPRGPQAPSAAAAVPATGAPPAVATIAGEPIPLALAPDPALQRLVDPRPGGRVPIWLGGDVAASVVVGPRRAAWLFGDTLLGTASGHCPPPQRFCARRLATSDAEESVLANSAGAMRFDARGRPSPLAFAWRRIAGAPAPVFATGEPGEILWPLAGARVAGRLVVAISRHARASGLVPLGNLLAVVENPASSPAAWRVSFAPVPNVRAGFDESDPLTWTTALVPAGGHVYLFGQRGVGFDARTVLCRVPARAMADGDPLAPEYLVHRPGDGAPQWSDRFALEALYDLPGLPGTSEATFERHPELGWVTFQIPPLGFEIRMYTAPDLAGPWRDRGAVYAIPPPWSTTLRRDCRPPEAGCGQERFAAYAVKSHPELAPAGGFALTYNVNVLNGTLESAARTAADYDAFYVPQFVAGAPLPR